MADFGDLSTKGRRGSQGLKTQDLGGVSIDRVVEIESMALPREAVLPHAPMEAIEAAMAILPPGTIEPGTRAMRLSFHSYLIRTRHHRILVDTCFGNDKERPYLAEANRRNGDFLARLAAFGVAPEEIDFVLCTHLHVDHVGWNTRLVDGRWVPTFPNARYVMGVKDYDHFLAGHDAASEDARRISAFADSVLPIVAAGRAVLIDGEHEIDDAIRIEPWPGHSPGHQIVHVAGDRAGGVMTGDCFHHPIQLLHPEWHTGYCVDPVWSARQRRRLLERFADTPTLIFPAHFLPPAAGRIERAGDAFRFAFVSG
jgi:glyoxylase-like metal-dependent hydrolase (beta-lactamase superfamily II)